MLTYLYDQYGGALYGVAIRIVGSDVFAEEVLQDAFVKIWKNVDQYDEGKGRLFTWMMRIVRNEAIDKRRSAEVNRMAKTGSIDENVYTIDQVNQTEIKVDDIGIKDLLRNLNEEDQKILDLIYFQGYTHVQAAELLDMPLGTVKTKLRKGISKLREILVKR